MPLGLLLVLLLVLSCTQAEESAPAPVKQASHSSLQLWEQLPPLHRVHIFYYLWYGNPSEGGRWAHWDHEMLSHWDAQQATAWPQNMRFEPPDCIHSPYYPMRGPYSSASKELMMQHVQELERAGVGVIVASWWGPRHRKGSTDTQGVNTDMRVALLAHVIESMQTQVRIAFHMEPYEGRTLLSVREDLDYLAKQYATSTALLKIDGKPIFYMYDSYRIPAADWASLLKPNGAHTVRGTALDGWFIALLLEKDATRNEIAPAGWDGFYSYFASESVSYASNPQNWRSLAQWAAARDLLWIPSLGPGYDDRKIRPWNAGATREREGGARYAQQWEAALQSGAFLASITSYNEYGEGTQIEPCVSRPIKNGCAYHDYGPEGAMLYMRLTAKWAELFTASTGSRKGTSRRGSQRATSSGSGACRSPVEPEDSTARKGGRMGSTSDSLGSTSDSNDGSAASVGSAQGECAGDVGGGAAVDVEGATGPELEEAALLEVEQTVGDGLAGGDSASAGAEKPSGTNPIAHSDIANAASRTDHDRQQASASSTSTDTGSVSGSLVGSGDSREAPLEDEQQTPKP